MEKTGDVKVKITYCDVCGRKSTIVDGSGGAFCEEHGKTKKAEDMPAGIPVGLKNSAAMLMPKHKVQPE